MTKLLLQSELLNMQIELWVLHLTPPFFFVSEFKQDVHLHGKYGFFN